MSQEYSAPIEFCGEDGWEDANGKFIPAEVITYILNREYVTPAMCHEFEIDNMVKIQNGVDKGKLAVIVGQDTTYNFCDIDNTGSRTGYYDHELSLHQE